MTEKIKKETCSYCSGCFAEYQSITEQDTTDVYLEKSPARLMQWPCKLRLIPPHAPYLDGRDLLLCADCAALAHRDFHKSFMKNRITMSFCPQTESGECRERLEKIISDNNIKSITLVQMEVGCCDEAELLIEEALKTAKKEIPYKKIIVSTTGKISN